MFGAGNGGMINPPNPDLTFVLSLAEVAVFNVDAYHLLMDLTVLAGMAKVGLLQGGEMAVLCTDLYLIAATAEK